MLTMMLLALAVTAQDSSERHVRAAEPRILALIDAGTTRSATFRRLIAALDESDVIVYIEPKVTRQALGGYLAHNITTAGAYRYLHVAIETAGSEGRLIPLLAHELQHAIEVAQSPDARDSESLERVFGRLAVRFGCGGTSCSETQAAKDVERVVGDELKTALTLRQQLARKAPAIPRVRANGDQSIAALLQEGTLRSATFQRLVARIDASDGLVYVEHGQCHHQVRACLALTVRVAGPSRMLRIVVDTRRDHDELLAAIGHELQHAIEALGDSHVTDDMTIYNFFRRIAPTDKGRFETEEAIEIGLNVMSELRAGVR